MWYLCQTKARDENRAKINLERQGYRVNVPTLDSAPLFPGYIFVQVDHKPFAPINSTRGVLCLVRFGIELAIVPDDEVQRLEETEWARSDECAPGKKVRIAEGAFNLHEGIVAAKTHERIYVWLSFLGEERKLPFPLKHVVAA